MCYMAENSKLIFDFETAKNDVIANDVSPWPRCRTMSRDPLFEIPHMTVIAQVKPEHFCFGSRVFKVVWIRLWACETILKFDFSFHVTWSEEIISEKSTLQFIVGKTLVYCLCFIDCYRWSRDRSILLISLAIRHRKNFNLWRPWGLDSRRHISSLYWLHGSSWWNSLRLVERIQICSDLQMTDNLVRIISRIFYSRECPFRGSASFRAKIRRFWLTSSEKLDFRSEQSGPPERKKLKNWRKT